MARYPKRQKVKRYRRSFYTREMRLKKGIGIAVLVVAVLAIFTSVFEKDKAKPDDTPGSGLGGCTPCAGLGHPHLVYRGAGS